MDDALSAAVVIPLGEERINLIKQFEIAFADAPSQRLDTEYIREGDQILFIHGRQPPDNRGIVDEHIDPAIFEC